MDFFFKDKCLVILMCLYLAIYPACSDSVGPNDSSQQAPEIPPQGTMLIDLSFF
ncbi:MAG: hypothetical protein ACE5HS_03400 [bacterium]